MAELPKIKFDTSRWDDPVTRSEMADVIIQIAISLRAINIALVSLDNHDKLMAATDDITKAAEELGEMWKAMSGMEGQ